jgi:hypothetical protein
MKKLLTICLIMATVFTVNAQTKEETISWLKEKLEKYLGVFQLNDLKLEELNECEFIISGRVIIGYGNKNTHLDMKYFFPTKGVNIDSEGYISYDIEAVRVIMIPSHESRKEYFLNGGKKFSLSNREQDIYARIQKALDHLASFCPKKKETF